MERDVEDHAQRTPEQVMYLEEALGRVGDEALLRHQVLAIKRPAFLRGWAREHTADRARKTARGHDLQMMPGHAFVQRRAGQLSATMQTPRLAEVRQRHEERAAAIAVESGRPLIRGEGDECSQEIRRWRNDELAVRDGHEPPLERELVR